MAIERINEKMLTEVLKSTFSQNAIETGYLDIDHLVGGLYKGDTYLLAGCPAEGKTAFALSLVEKIGISQGKSVAYFSLADSRDEILKRLIKNVSMIECLSEANQAKIEAGVQAIDNAHIYINAIPGVSADEIREECCSIEEPLSLVIVDDSQAMDSWSNKEDEVVYEQLDRLKELALELDCPILIIESLNDIRKRKSFHPMVSDLSFRQIRRHVDNIWLLDRNFKCNRRSNGSHIAELIVAQNNHGDKYHIRLAWLPEFMRFCSVDNPEEWEVLEGYQFKEVIQ